MTILQLYLKHKNKIRISLCTLGMVFIAILIHESFNTISQYLKQIHWSTFCISLTVGIIGSGIQGFLLHQVFGKFGVVTDRRSAIKLFTIGQIAKYIPGKVWNIVYQFSFFSKPNDMRGIAFANIEFMGLAMFVVAVTAFTLYIYTISVNLSVVIYLIGVAVFMVLLCSKISTTLIQHLSNRFPNWLTTSEEQTQPVSTLSGAAIFVASSSAYVLSHMLMLSAVFDLSVEDSVQYIVLLSIAWLGGVIVFIVPLGLGVRELLFVAASSIAVPTQSEALLISIAVMSRMWLVIVDILCASLATILLPSTLISQKK